MKSINELMEISTNSDLQYLIQIIDLELPTQVITIPTPRQETIQDLKLAASDVPAYIQAPVNPSKLDSLDAQSRDLVAEAAQISFNLLLDNQDLAENLRHSLKLIIKPIGLLNSLPDLDSQMRNKKEQEIASKVNELILVTIESILKAKHTHEQNVLCEIDSLLNQINP